MENIMKILSLGINDIRSPCDGLPEYERYFAKYFSQDNELVMLNVIPRVAKETIEVAELQLESSTKEAPLVSVRQIIASIPGFFDSVGHDIKNYIAMTKAMKFIGFKPDVIIMHDWFFAPVLASASNLPKVIYMCHLFNIALDQVLDYQYWLAEYSEEIGMIDIADIIIANSMATKKDVIAAIPQVGFKTEAIHLGVDKSIYTPSPNYSSKKILYLGRLDEQKGMRGFIKSIKNNRDKIKESGFEIIVAGDGAYYEEIARLHFDGLINYVGSIDREKKLEYIKDCKYMIFPSIYEPYGLSLNEGLACAKLCLVTDTSGHREQVTDGFNGVYITHENWFDKLLELENSPKSQKKYSNNAVSSARDISAHFRKLKGVIDELQRT
jgi:glycosyltransferase involved in cell wall biosynthesis